MSRTSVAADLGTVLVGRGPEVGGVMQTINGAYCPTQTRADARGRNHP